MFFMGQRKIKFKLNKFYLRAFFTLCLFIFSTHSLAAVTKNWIATDDGTEKLWSDSANWSGGDGNAAGIGDVAIFDGNKGQSSVKLTGNISIRGLKAKNAYSGTINLNGSNLVSARQTSIWGAATVLVPSGSLFRTNQHLVIGSATTLTASGTGNIYVKSNFQNYGTFTAPSSSGSFIVKGGFNNFSGGVFNHNNGTVNLITRYKNQSSGVPSARILIQGGPGDGRNFYNLTKTFKRGIYLASDIEIENDLIIADSGLIRAND